MKLIYIYYHICTIGVWFLMVKNCFNRIIKSGLMKKIEKMFITVLGNDLDLVKKIFNHEKVEIIFHSVDLTLYERPCLKLIHSHALGRDDNFILLYLHSKGVSKLNISSNYRRFDWNDNSVYDWIEMLTYYIVDLFETCIKNLEHNDTCGVNLYKYHQHFHYSGNFWWANSHYIKNLNPEIGDNYLDPEMWIGRCEKYKMVSLWNSDMNHYNQDYPLCNYIDKINIMTVSNPPKQQ